MIGPEKVAVKRSTIHGKGLFALSKIDVGEVVGEFEGKKVTRNSKYVLWLEEDQGILVRNLLKYANHSKRPNTEVVGTTMRATRDISPHEEITFDYGSDWD